MTFHVCGPSTLSITPWTVVSDKMFIMNPSGTCRSHRACIKDRSGTRTRDHRFMNPRTVPLGQAVLCEHSHSGGLRAPGMVFFINFPCNHNVTRNQNVSKRLSTSVNQLWRLGLQPETAHTCMRLNLCKAAPVSQQYSGIPLWFINP